MSVQHQRLGAMAPSEPASGWVPGMGTSLEDAPVGSKAHSSEGGSEDERCCWLCLGGEDEGLGALTAPCRCPRLCHPACLSRWQLHCAGKIEEKACRFCGQQLPDWRHTPPLVPGSAVPAAAAAPPAFMRISYNGRSHKIRVRPGPDGTKQFVDDCRKLLKIPDHLDFDVVFHCKEPATQSDLRYRGLDAYDAAVYCASLANHAALQQAAQQQQQQLLASMGSSSSTASTASASSGPGCPAPAPPPVPPLVRATSEVADQMALMLQQQHHMLMEEDEDAEEEEEAAAEEDAMGGNDQQQQDGARGVGGGGVRESVQWTAGRVGELGGRDQQQQQQQAGGRWPRSSQQARRGRRSAGRVWPAEQVPRANHHQGAMAWREEEGEGSGLEGENDAYSSGFDTSREVSGGGGGEGGSVDGVGVGGGGGVGGMGALASMVGSAVGSVLGAFRRCSS